jgi:UDP-glucuronate decarboxylase
MHPSDGRVISNFIVQALQNLPITLYGNGMQTRSFCYVDDLIDAMISMMKTQAYQTGPINLGNPLEYTIRENDYLFNIDSISLSENVILEVI